MESRHFGIRVSLPDPDNWRVVDDERWLSLAHDKSESLLRLRLWTAPPRITKEACLAQLYLWRGELRSVAEPMVERSLRAPSGYDVALRIDLAEPAHDQQAAILLAFGASVRRCYAATFETTATRDSAAELAARLRLISDGVLDQVELIKVDEFAPRRSFEEPQVYP
jgi:hypothetical protein